MNEIPLLLTVVGIHLLAWLTPGPIAVLLIRNSLIYSRSTGLWTSVGVAVGNFIHLLFAVLGTSALFTTSDLAFNLLLYAGVGYLVYLGLKTLTMPAAPPSNEGKQKNRNRLSPLSAFKSGLIADLMSPKAFIFFLSVVAGVYAAEPAAWVPLSLLVIMPITTLTMASIYSHVFSHKHAQKVYQKFQKTINNILGFALILLALLVALNS